MDRRQRRTREAIYSALSKLLKSKPYSSITVQEIIDEANVGRTTFYSHFETKDTLLKELSTEIFSHIFQNKSMTVPVTSPASMQNALKHVLYHLKNNQPEILCALSDDTRDIFMEHFRNYLKDVLGEYASDRLPDVPHDYKANYLVESFCSTITWWINQNFKGTPEETMNLFCRCIGYDFFAEE